MLKIGNCQIATDILIAIIRAQRQNFPQGFNNCIARNICDILKLRNKYLNIYFVIVYVSAAICQFANICHLEKCLFPNEGINCEFRIFHFCIIKLTTVGMFCLVHQPRSRFPQINDKRLLETRRIFPVFSSVL